MPIDEDQRAVLGSIRTIDFTTFGRRTGQPSRIEIWWFEFERRFVITGTPGRRDWLANVRANPDVIVHANGYDYPGQAHPIVDTEFRQRFFRSTVAEVRWYANQAEMAELVARAPMIEVHLD